jgi:hypothetical protein
MMLEQRWELARSCRDAKDDRPECEAGTRVSDAARKRAENRRL